MDAIVLVGGQGTRLRPLTLTRHKSLVPVRNRPAIEYLFQWLERSGFERAVLAIGQNNEDLADAYQGGRPGRLHVQLVQERERLESGGAIRNAVRTAGIEGRFLVLNGDVFIDFDWSRALKAHEEAGADLTLALHEVRDPSSFGVAVIDGDSRVTGFVEKPPPGTAPSKLVNAGAWIFEPHLVAEIPAGAVRVEESLFPSLVARRRPVLGHRIAGVWADIGTPERYLALNCALLARDGVDHDADGVEIATGASLHRSSAGPGSSLGQDAAVSDSILWEGVEVGSGVTIGDSILADGVHVGEGATIRGAVVGRGATIGPHSAVAAGSLIDPGATLS